MAKLTEDQMKRFVEHCNSMLGKNHIINNITAAGNLNIMFRQRFFNPVINDAMFRLDKDYECCVVAGVFGISHVDFYRIRKYIKPVKGKTHNSQHSHKLPFHLFAHRHCNPWIVFELEKVLFEMV